MKEVLAFDLGASNGRLMMSGFDGKRIHLKEIHRFTNKPIHMCNHYYWDILHIFQEMKNGISKNKLEGHTEVQSLGVDTWGVDFGLLSKSGELLSNPFSYRDPQINDGFQEVLKTVSKAELFRRTGNEPAPINTIYQLKAIHKRLPMLVEQAESLLFTPSLISYLFSGVRANEFTISTTSQLYDHVEKDWDYQLMEQLNLPSNIFSPVINPGTILGQTLNEINLELGINPIKVTAVAGHDTACALAALPIKNKQSAFMSCGTWVLIGVQVEKPVVSDAAFDWGFTNEGTLDGEYRLLKNNMGLWLLQQCQAVWAREGHLATYEEQNEWVKASEPFVSFIDPDHAQFFNPENMPLTIYQYCENTGQEPLHSKGQIIRCILESLALKYRWVIERLERLTASTIEVIHMGGGGIQNEWLCQFTANATNRPVIAGPVEASAIGNSLSQWMALGEIKNLSEARDIVAESFHTKEYYPQNLSEWEEAYQRFVNLVELRV